jgi:hypothetical protein
MQPTRYRSRRGRAGPQLFEAEPDDAADAPDDAWPADGDDDGPAAAAPEDPDASADDEPVSDDEPPSVFDEPDGDDGAADDEPEPPLWQSADGHVLHLPTRVVTHLVRPRPRPRPKPRPPRRRPPSGRPGRRPLRPASRRRGRPVGRRQRRGLIRRVGQLARGARRVGALRHRGTGRRFPVFRGRSGGRPVRMVTRRGGGRRHEILLVQPELRPGSTHQQEGPGWRTRDGARLRLTHTGLHRILARLPPRQLRSLTQGELSGDPAPALVRTVGRIARAARRAGSVRGPSGTRLPVFVAPGSRLLVAPRGRAEGEILHVRFRTPHLSEEAEVALPLTQPLTTDQKEALRRAATSLFSKVYPRYLRQQVEVHHRVPLEWSHLFPQADPNRISNLQGLSSPQQLRKATEMWSSFRDAHRRSGHPPTPQQVLRFATLVDRALGMAYPR